MASPLTAELDRWMGLAIFKTYADLRAESARTYVGFLWWIAEPLLSLGVYYIVFELILDRGTENYVAFLFTGLVPWRWLSTTLVHGSGSILFADNLMQQVYLPKVLFPIVAFLTDTFKFLVVFAVLLVFVRISGFPLGWSYLALPLVLLVQGLLVIGVTLIAAGITPFIPDLRVVLENLVRVWLFLSGIFYDVGALSADAQWYFRLNPMTSVIEAYRHILLDGVWPSFAWLSIVTVLALALCALGALLIHRFDYTYPKLANR
ncbi:MAG: ABC transporter permease [Acidobacteria bacterium]|nr:MAG: ABC transporter permease [Acidobacteriota bacterium]